MKLSIIIVSYNTKDCLQACIQSIVDNATISYEIIVVDNNSSDGSELYLTTLFHSINWINTGYNAGFSRANNKGLKAAKGEYVMLLNPDTVVKSGFFEDLLNFYVTNDSTLNLGLLGCRIKTIDGKELLVGSRNGFPSVKKILLYNPFVYKFNTSLKFIKLPEYNPEVMHLHNHPIDYLSGACLLIKRDKIEQGNLYMDEDFFLYAEDVEWCYRIKKQGYTNYFCAEAEVYHINSGSTDSMMETKFLQIMLSKLLLIYKCYGFLYFLTYCAIIRTNSLGYKFAQLFKLDFKREREQELLNQVVNEKFGTLIKLIFSKSKHLLKY